MERGLTRAWAKFDRADPLILFEVERNGEIAEDIGAACRQLEGGRHLQNQIRLAQAPAFGELWKLGRFGGVAFRHSLADPLGDRADLRIRKLALVRKLAESVRRMPGRHISRLYDRGDQGAALLEVFVRDQREGRGFAWAMTSDAVLVDDRRDVFVKGDLVSRGKHRGGRNERSSQFNRHSPF